MAPVAGAGLVLASVVGFREIMLRQEATALARAVDLSVAPWALPVTRYSARRGLDAFTVSGIIRTESNGNPAAIGDGGSAIGLMQVHVKYWGDLAKNFDLRDPTDNIRAGTYVLLIATLEARDRDVPEDAIPFVSIAAYNCGITNAIKGYKLGDPERFTYGGNYVSKVLGHRNRYVEKASKLA